MSTKILYRKVLPCSSPSTLIPHPHKTPTQAPPPSHPNTDPDTMTLPTDNDRNSSTQTSTSENKAVSSSQETKPEDQIYLSSEKKQSSPGPVANEEAASKVALGEITEIKGVIFDMDGTLTIPVLRFMDIIAEVGLKPTDDILPTVQKMPEKERARAFEIIAKYEREGIEKMKLQPGVLDMLHYLEERGIKRALLTRNSRVPTDAFLKKLGEELDSKKDDYPSLNSEDLFSQVITREFEPCKPHPAAVFEVVKNWQLKPEEVVFVGDDKTDMLCGLRAGVGVNILLRNDRNKNQIDYSHFKVNSLPEIITLMSSLMTVPYKQEAEP